MNIFKFGIALTVFAQIHVASAEECPAEWGVTVMLVEDSTSSPTPGPTEGTAGPNGHQLSYGQPQLKVSRDLIAKDKLVADRYFTFDRRMLKVEDTRLVGAFSQDNGKTTTDFEIGFIHEAIEMDHQICLNVALNDGIGFQKVDKKKQKTDCGILPEWMCQKAKTTHLRISVDAGRKPFVLDSTSSFSRD